MSTINLSVEIDEDVVEKELLRVFRQEVRSLLANIAREVLPQIQDVVELAIKASPEYNSLLNGDLQAEFGLANPAPVLQGIIDAVRQSVVVTATKPNSNTLGGLTVEILKIDFSEVLAVEGTTYVSESHTRGPSEIPWLKWLLFAGDRVVLADFEISYTTRSAASRTGRAIMVSKRSPASRQPSRKTGFVPWRVPPEFAGDPTDNWLTRSLEFLEPEMQDILEKAIGNL